jgi:hypothetical protein
MTISPFSTGSSGYTFACWFRSNNNGQWARVFDFGNGPASDNIQICVTELGITLAVYVGQSGTSSIYTFPGSYNDNIWYHVSWTLHPDGTWLLYINGMLAQQLLSMRYPTSIVRSINYLGRSLAANPYFSGAISDFRLYSRVLSATEVAALYAATPTSFPTSQPSPSSRMPTSFPSPDLPTMLPSI